MSVPVAAEGLPRRIALPGADANGTLHALADERLTGLVLVSVLRHHYPRRLTAPFL
jgi:hypothetical protein